MFDFEETPKSKKWKNLPQEKRDLLIKDFLLKKKLKI